MAFEISEFADKVFLTNNYENYVFNQVTNDWEELDIHGYDTIEEWYNDFNDNTNAIERIKAYTGITIDYDRIKYYLKYPWVVGYFKWYYDLCLSRVDVLIDLLNGTKKYDIEVIATNAEDKYDHVRISLMIDGIIYVMECSLNHFDETVRCFAITKEGYLYKGYTDMLIEVFTDLFESTTDVGVLELYALMFCR